MITDNTWINCAYYARNNRNSFGPPSKQYLDRTMLNFYYRSCDGLYLTPQQLKCVFMFDVQGVCVVCLAMWWCSVTNILIFERVCVVYWILHLVKVKNITKGFGIDIQVFFIILLICFLMLIACEMTVFT